MKTPITKLIVKVAFALISIVWGAIDIQKAVTQYKSSVEDASLEEV